MNKGKMTGTLVDILRGAGQCQDMLALVIGLAGTEAGV